MCGNREFFFRSGVINWFLHALCFFFICLRIVCYFSWTAEMQKISAHTLKRNLPFIHVIAILKSYGYLYASWSFFGDSPYWLSFASDNCNSDFNLIMFSWANMGVAECKLLIFFGVCFYSVNMLPVVCFFFARSHKNNLTTIFNQNIFSRFSVQPNCVRCCLTKNVRWGDKNIWASLKTLFFHSRQVGGKWLYPRFLSL